MKQKASYAGLLLERELSKEPIKYKTETALKSIAPAYDGKLRLDFFLPAQKVVIEVNGAQHAKPLRREWDETKRWFLVQYGYFVVYWYVNYQPRTERKKAQYARTAKAIVEYLRSGLYEPVKVFWD